MILIILCNKLSLLEHYIPLVYFVLVIFIYKLLLLLTRVHYYCILINYRRTGFNCIVKRLRFRVLKESNYCDTM